MGNSPRVGADHTSKVLGRHYQPLRGLDVINLLLSAPQGRASAQTFALQFDWALGYCNAADWALFPAF